MNVRRKVTQQQLALFAPDDADPPSPSQLGLRALAERLPKHVRFGTSSWTFEGWQGLVYHRRYPNKAAFVHESLAEYARHPLFRTVGIDRSYYAPLSRDDFAYYRSQLPDAFRCVTKVFSEITRVAFPEHPRFGARAGHRNPSFLDANYFLEWVGQPTKSGLGPCAGPFLLQFPPFPPGFSPSEFTDKLASFLAACGPDYAFAIEVRNAQFLSDRCYAVAADHGATLCFNYWERMPSLREQLARLERSRTRTSCPFMVVRLLIPPNERYAVLKERYAPFDQLVAPQLAMREDVATLVRYGALLEKELFVLVNNKAEGSSPKTIEALAERLAAEAAPPTA